MKCFLSFQYLEEKNKVSHDAAIHFNRKIDPEDNKRFRNERRKKRKYILFVPNTRHKKEIQAYCLHEYLINDLKIRY